MTWHCQGCNNEFQGKPVLLKGHTWYGVKPIRGTTKNNTVQCLFVYCSGCVIPNLKVSLRETIKGLRGNLRRALWKNAHTKAS